MEEKKGYQASLKSSETEDWLDLHVIRPLCYLIARGFAVLDINPNTVTIWSMFIGAASAYFFAQGCFYYNGTWGLVMNLIGVVLLMWADIFDCVDGQLARLTGKKSAMGRILDGAAGFTWFVPIYVCMVIRFYMHHSLEFDWLGIADTQQNAIIATAVVFVLGLISGIMGIAGQQRLADYYIQIHLYFLKGEKGSELDNSVTEQQKLDAMTKDTPWAERLFQKNYVQYTKNQEAVTPQFQRFMKLAKEKYGSASNLPQAIRDAFHDESLKIIFWNGLLTFNFRTAFLFLFLLIDLPAGYFLWEIVGMGLLYMYVNRRHERLCKKLCSEL